MVQTIISNVLKVFAEQIGPSFVHLHFESFLGRGVMLQYVLPVEPFLQKIVHVFYTEKSWLPPFAKLVLLGEVITFIRRFAFQCSFPTGESILLERDIAVWNNKTYLDHPKLIKEDHLIKKHRNWYSQFYSENSPRISDFKNESLEW